MATSFRNATLFLVFGFFLASVGIARSQEPGVGIQNNLNVLGGRIQFQNLEEKVEPATIRLLHLGTETQFSTVTGPDSRTFVLPVLPDGAYEISIETQSGFFYLVQIVEITGGNRHLMNFLLEPGPVTDTVTERIRRRDLDPDLTIGLARLDPGRTVADKGRKLGRRTGLLMGILGGAVVLNEVFVDDDLSPSGP